MRKTLYVIMALVLALGSVIPLAGCGTVGDSGALVVQALASVDPMLVDPWTSGNATFECAEGCCCDSEFHYKFDDWNVSYNGPYTVDGRNTITISNNDGYSFDWTSQWPVSCVIVKGGTMANVYCYPGGAYSDTGMFAPINPNNQKHYAISHATFCFNGPEVVPQATLSVVKFFDANANGVWHASEPLLDNWYFTIDGALYSTPFSDTVDVGVHNITELMPDEPNWVASNITVVGTESYTINSNIEVEVTLEENDDVTIYFGNYCLEPSGGFSPGYWSQVVMSGGKNPVVTGSRRISAELYDAFVDYITNVNPVTLVNNDGSPASFDNALTLSQWIGSGLDAVNMAAQLSRHTAAMILNILSGAVAGDAYYIPAGMAVQEIVDAAKALLNANPIIIEAGELRDQAEQLKDWLDELNNNAHIVPSEPCPYTFTLL